MAEEETQSAAPLTYAQIQKKSYEGRAQAVQTNFTSDSACFFTIWRIFSIWNSKNYEFKILDLICGKFL